MLGWRELAAPVLIGVIEDPENSPCWNDAKRFLEPAAKRGGVPILDVHELLWIVAMEGELVAAATTRLTDGWAEIVLVGGENHRRWLKALDEQIGNWARDEGKDRLRAFGRPGWKRVLGWNVIGEQDGIVGYERLLN